MSRSQVFICQTRAQAKITEILEIRPGISMEKISILRVMKKKWTHPRFLHRGPKKAVEQDSDVHFDLT